MRVCMLLFFFFSSRRRHTRCLSDWSSDVCSSDLFKANYTYGKAMDLNSAILAPSAGNEPSNIPSPYDRKRLNRGVASFSVLHQFNAYYSYQLPFGNGQRFGAGSSGVVDKLIGGWQWNGSLRAAGGFP